MGDNDRFCKNCRNTLDETLSYEDIKSIANYLLERVSVRPKFGIICGSGLGPIGETLQNRQTFLYKDIQKDIPHFPVSTVEGHAGKLLFGYIGNVPVVCFQGRFHFYEGYPLSKCVMPVRLMKLLGVSTLIASNAAGSINPSYRTGDLMLIKDHINLVGIAGQNPLRGRNDEYFGKRFVALNDAYHPLIIKHVKALATKLGIKRVQEGVYGCVGGPNFETVAEIRALKNLGVDAVGMSTVHEIIAARHCNLNCFAFSLITNECIMHYDTDEKPEHEEIMGVAKDREEDLKKLIENLIPHLVNNGF